MTDRAPLASRADVAKYLGVPAGTLTQWAHKEKGPKYRIIGRHARYDWRDVEQWLNEQQAGGGASA